MNLNELQFSRRQGLDVPIANQFYKRVDKRLKARADDVVWTAQHQGQTVAALRLRPLPTGDHLLTGVLVDPEFRTRGIAKRLLAEASIDFSRRYLYLFCEPQLAPLYNTAGFVQVQKIDMPDHLVGRWQAYQRKTPELIAMCYL
ncbi:GNAT family N-acetyltransferase [Simiduia sp. 21SJ11W-1]|uniref:GNAT family N-acetyltransferase n=1 Tax=Simiduia sp. 21SJ11W-1 TaxID=2909669 RepID=UPI00209EEF73|nr:GNAT family N-acetyltransferase [Simiduia sp. 21SJ11W-1]UTA47861.1 GNAT family N-acetyltransferase [Simiduia sp. 21SJ11W-1]